MKAFPVKNQLYRLKLKLHRFLVWHTKLNICQGAEGPCFKKGTRQRQNTAYADDKRNWVTLCSKCAQINAEYWDGMWRDYYGMVM